MPELLNKHPAAIDLQLFSSAETIQLKQFLEVSRSGLSICMFSASKHQYLNSRMTWEGRAWTCQIYHKLGL